MFCRQRRIPVFLGFVRLLSNLFSKPGESGFPLQLAKAAPEHLTAALECVLSTTGRPADTAQMVLFMQSARARGIDVSQVWVALRQGRVQYAILPMLIPGRTMMLISGNLRKEQVPAAGELLARVVQEYAKLDLSLMQTLVASGDQALIGVYEAGGFSRLTELIYLEASPRTLAWKLPDSSWDMVPYSEQAHGQFTQAILASYQGTLDCPELEGVRKIEDVIAGHRAAGLFDPRSWFMLRQSQRPAGVLLLAKIPGTDALELVYIGLAPFARGQGIGRELMKLALASAVTAKCGRLTTAVDFRNTPAVQMYYHAGMQRIGSRLALMRVIHRPGEFDAQSIPK